MSRVVKNVIVWVLALAVILCIIAGFTFGLSSVSGVADALSSFDLVNNGVVRENLVVYSSAEEIYNDLTSSSSAMWTVTQSSDDFHLTEDGYLSFDGFCSLDYHTSITYDSSYYAVWSVGVLVHSATTSPQTTITSIAMASTSRNRQWYFDSTEVNTFQVLTQERQFSGDLTRLGFQVDTGSYLSLAWVKLEISFGADDVGFTGYVPYSKGTYDEGYDAGYDAGVTDGTETGYDEGYDEGYNAGVTDGTQSGYDKGYADGYDEGYNNGLADEVYTASQAFKSSGYNYVSVLSPGTSTRFEAEKAIGALVSDYENVNIPLSGLYFAASDLVANDMGGLVEPLDMGSLVGDTVYELYSSSQYAMTFNNYVEMAQWLIDNPMDNLVLIPSNINNPSSDGIYPVYFVMNDRSLLDRFVSGAGAAYDLGYQGGYNAGYDVGDGSGYDRGYGEGFNDGQADASSGNYTFLALIGSVLDAPISAFKGLLDFDLLGVNMSSFVLAIMSLCVIIVIIRVVLR